MKLFSLIVALASGISFSGCVSADSKSDSTASGGGRPVVSAPSNPGVKNPGVKNPETPAVSNYENLNTFETSEQMVKILSDTAFALSDEEKNLLNELQNLDSKSIFKLSTSKNGEVTTTPISRFFELSEDSRSIHTAKLNVISGWFFGFQKNNISFYFPNAWTNADSRGAYDSKTGQFKFETKGESGELLIVVGASRRGEMIRKIAAKFEQSYLEYFNKDGPWKSKYWPHLLNLIQSELSKHVPEGIAKLSQLQFGQFNSKSSASVIWNRSNEEQIVINMTNPLPVYGETSEVTLTAGSEDWLFESGMPISKSYAQVDRTLLGLTDLEYEIRSFISNENSKLSKYSRTVFVAHEIKDSVKPEVVVVDGGWKLFDEIGALEPTSIQIESESSEVLVSWFWEDFEKTAFILASGTGKFVVSACDKSGNCTKESFDVDTSVREEIAVDALEDVLIIRSSIKEYWTGQ